MATSENSSGKVAVTYHTAPSPHLSDTSVTTQGMMRDVLIGLAPAFLVSLYVFGWYSVLQIGVCVLSCMAAEFLFAKMRGQRATLEDLTALVTGVILGMSLPWSAPWYVGFFGGFVAIGLGKMVFGGLGFNIFNPAMVGRAFVMLSFAKALGASAYVSSQSAEGLVTQATPLTLMRGVQEGHFNLSEFWPLFTGLTNGSIGETSALALLIGGIYLCWRRSAAWEIPASIFAGVLFLGGLCNLMELSPITGMQHLVSGSLVFGAFFIATDPVSSPLTMKGKAIFGLGIAFFTVLLRVFSSYPEGVMFAVLIMNACVPLIDRYTVPQPMGAAAATAKA